MIQVDLAKLDEVMKGFGMNLDDHPDLAAQMMMANDQLAKIPEMDAESLQTIMQVVLSAILMPISEAPHERY